MKNQKLLDAIDKFAAMMDLPPTKVSPGSQLPGVNDNEQFAQQRERLAQFYEHFTSSLRRIRNELESEIGTLRMRNFDPKMWKLLVKVFQTVVEIYRETNPEKPYIAAEKLVHYVLDRQTAMYIDNLDFLAKHHLKETNVDFKASPVLGHPQMRSLDALKALAHELRQFMERYPLVKPLTTPPPRMGLPEIAQDIGSEQKAGKEDKTKA